MPASEGLKPVAWSAMAFSAALAKARRRRSSLQSKVAFVPFAAQSSTQGRAFFQRRRRSCVTTRSSVPIGICLGCPPSSGAKLTPDAVSLKVPRTQSSSTSSLPGVSASVASFAQLLGAMGSIF